MKEKIKVENIKTGVVKEVPENLASELIGTKEWKIIEKTKTENIKNSFSSMSKNEE